MYSKEILSIDLALADLAGHVPPEIWEIVRIIRRNLKGLADQLENLELNMEISNGNEN